VDNEGYHNLQPSKRLSSILKIRICPVAKDGIRKLIESGRLPKVSHVGYGKSGGFLGLSRVGRERRGSCRTAAAIGRPYDKGIKDKGC
jgi:hypothetical protein